MRDAPQRNKTLLPFLMVGVSLILSSCGGGTPSTTSPPPPPPPSTANQWTWVSGYNVFNPPGTYGLPGQTGPTYLPGSREQASGWTDTSGNLWVFGGNGFAPTLGLLNDLWKYSAGEWTWVSGADSSNSNYANYGTLGVTASSNLPGPRDGSSSWTDASGNFWLFGGNGGAILDVGPLNDLWEYSAGNWTWMGGANVANSSGVYGTLGTPAASNVPGARFHAASWTDTSGNFWLFGGNFNASNSPGDFYFNDLWKYSSGEWTWVGGSSSTNQPGTYGTLGVASASNVPGARQQAASWTDTSGNLWLFGGDGLDSTGTYGFLNDLWKFSAGQWTWVSGSNLANQSATYGTMGTASANNVPGARFGSAAWTDSSGNLWLFGGAAPNGVSPSPNYLSDLWKFSAGEWTWMGGPDQPNYNGTYGTQGTPSASNIPGGRYGPVTWTDASGNFWLFGGNNLQGLTNDLWKYQP
jgi:hypothetical protein